MSYISPIAVNFIDEVVEKTLKDRETAITTAVMQKVKIVVDVDEKELIKALRYDRNQYGKGYHDGYYEAIEKVRTRLKEIGVEFNYLDAIISQI